MILFHNITEKPISFNELKKLTQQLISPILLSNRLKEMINFKLIKRIKINNKICYVISEEGIEFKKIMHNMKKWAIKNNYNLPKKCTKKVCACDSILKTSYKKN